MASTPAMKYNPAFLTEEELIRNFVVRQKHLELILEVIRENGPNNSQHILIVAPRGAGKTTIVLRAASEIRRNKEFSETWYPVVFSEDSYEVCTPGEFWLEALFHIGEQIRNKRWQSVYEDLRRESDEDRLRERALSQLMDFADERDRRLLLVVENLNMMLGQQISPDDAWKLRHTLLNEPRIMILGTAISRFDELDNSKNAMFELFKIHDLEPLNTDECQKLWVSTTGQQLDLNRIRPIQILTGGSPRLIVIISSFVAKTSFKELMENLTRLVDEHTEYFKSHLDNLPPQERKVFVTLADIWNPATAREIAENARISVNKVSAHLQRLLSKGAAVVAGQKGRKKWYQVAERMYNIYHLMRRRGEPSNRVRAVVDFIIHFYMGEDLVQLTKTVATEACDLGPILCTDHYRFIEEVLKRPQIERFRQKIIENIPDKIIGSLELPQALPKYIPIDKSKTEIKDRKLTEEEIETGILKRPEDPYALTLFALELIKKQPDRIEEAKAACEKAITIDSGYRPGWLAFGTILQYEIEDFEGAEEAYKKVIEIDPKFASAWYLLGNLLYFDINRYEEAEKAYRRAIEIDPENVAAWFHFGNLLSIKLERYEEAEEAYRRVIEIDPKDVAAWSNLGILLSDKLKRYEGAEKAYRRAIEIDPKSALAWSNFGNLLSNNLNRFKEAEKAYRRAIEIDPNIFAFWANLGNLLSKDRDRYKEAEQAYKRAIELEPSVSQLWKALIKLQFESLKDPKKALNTAEQYLEASDRSAQSLNLLAWLFFENEYKVHLHRAEAWCREAIDKEKGNPAYFHTLASVLGGLGRWDESLKTARRFLNNEVFIKRKIKEITDYFITAAADGYAGDSINILEQHIDIPSLEPIIAGLKIFLGEELLTAQEIREIGQDVAERIKERMNT